MARPSLVERTIRAGKVRINGVIFSPAQQHLAYDGRLDGKRMLFGLYYGTEWKRDFVFLWGEKSGNGIDGPHCVDGSFPWEWWTAAQPDTMTEPRHD